MRYIASFFIFIIVLLTGGLSNLRKKPEPETPQGKPGLAESNKYESLVGPSEPLVLTEPQFCPRCHVHVANIRRTKQGIQIIRQGKPVLTFNNIKTTNNGKTTTGIPLMCPNGHTVVIGEPC